MIHSFLSRFFGEKPDQKKHMPINRAVSTNPLVNEDELKRIIGDSGDIVYRAFTAAQKTCRLVYIDGLTDKGSLEEYVIKPIVNAVSVPRTADPDLEALGSKIWGASLKRFESISEAIDEILSGNAVLFISGWKQGVSVQTQSAEHRGVDQSSVENLIRGPRDSFTETLRVNTSLIRRRLKDPGLRFSTHRVGRRSRTSVAVAYLESLAKPQLVEATKNKLDSIDIDAIQDSGQLEQLLDNGHWTPFPTIQYTERPDLAAMALLDGRIAVVMDTSPGVLLIPATLNQIMLSPEDYYHKPLVSSVVRLVRFTASVLVLVLPSLYIAMLSFHPELLPYPLLFTITGSRVDIPFPAVVEAFTMEGSIELIREASVRLPSPLGQVVGVIGGLIIGQAAVTAGLVSPVMVVIVALTAIGGFAIPNFDLGSAFRIMRFTLMVISAFLGLYGLVCGLIAILVHLSSINSFGVPYLTPWGPFTRDLADSVIKLPITELPLRSQAYGSKDQSRMGDDSSDERQRD